MGIPVVMVRGVLESGKTYFIKDALLRGDFGKLPKLLIISQEEGVEEYDDEFLKKVNASAVCVEKENWKPEYIHELVRTYKPHVIFVECNEMWGQKDLYYPEYFDVEQVMGIIDGETFSYYLNALRQTFVDMLKECEVVIINRASPTAETSQMKKNVKLINNKVSILALDHNGNKLSLESDLPYDVNAPVISVSLQHFGDFYLDTLENKERYNGKAVEFECQAFFSRKLPPKTFVAGRLAMTCCADDIELLGHLASYSQKISILNESWVKVKAVIHYTKFRGAPNEQVILDVISVTPTPAKSQEEGLLILK
ncbi:MAG: hypothetical protein IKL82_06350 [Clostridia bacterium]|nr:hypothetical protein [Clostridia bacterium]